MFHRFRKFSSTVSVPSINGKQLNGSLTTQKGFTAVQVQSNGVGESEGEREIEESETNIFKPKRTIHLGLKVTLSYYLLLVICKYISDLFHKVFWTLAN